MKPTSPGSVDDGRVARRERTGCGSVCRQPRRRGGAQCGRGRPVPRASSCSSRRPRNATRRSRACSIAAPRCAPADTEAGPALVVLRQRRRCSRSEFPHARAGLPRRRRLGVGDQAAGARHLAAARHRRRRPRSILRAAASPWRSSIPAFGRTPICRCAAFARSRISSAAAPCRSTTAATARTSRASWPATAAAPNGLYAGIAPGVDIVALRVLGDDCSGNTSDVIDALEWIAPQSRDLSHQGREPLARPRGARVDLHRSAGAGGRAAVAQGRRGGHRRRQQGHQRRDRAARLRRRRRAVQRAVVDLRRLARHAGLARVRPTIACRSRARAVRRGSICWPSRISSRPASNIVSLAAPGSRLFNELEHLQVPGANGAAAVLHAVGHQHGVARGGRRRRRCCSRKITRSRPTR